MKSELGVKMVRLRVAKAEEKDDARILAERKARREKLLAESARNPKPPCFVASWFRGRRKVVTLWKR